MNALRSQSFSPKRPEHSSFYPSSTGNRTVEVFSDIGDYSSSNLPNRRQILKNAALSDVGVNQYTPDLPSHPVDNCAKQSPSGFQNESAKRMYETVARVQANRQLRLERKQKRKLPENNASTTFRAFSRSILGYSSDTGNPILQPESSAALKSFNLMLSSPEEKAIYNPNFHHMQDTTQGASRSQSQDNVNIKNSNRKKCIETTEVNRISSIPTLAMHFDSFYEPIRRFSAATPILLGDTASLDNTSICTGLSQQDLLRKKVREHKSSQRNRGRSQNKSSVSNVKCGKKKRPPIVLLPPSMLLSQRQPNIRSYVKTRSIAEGDSLCVGGADNDGNGHTWKPNELPYQNRIESAPRHQENQSTPMLYERLSSVNREAKNNEPFIQPNNENNKTVCMVAEITCEPIHRISGLDDQDMQSVNSFPYLSKQLFNDVFENIRQDEEFCGKDEEYFSTKQLSSDNQSHSEVFDGNEQSKPLQPEPDFNVQSTPDHVVRTKEVIEHNRLDTIDSGECSPLGIFCSSPDKWNGHDTTTAAETTLSTAPSSAHGSGIGSSTQSPSEASISPPVSIRRVRFDEAIYLNKRPTIEERTEVLSLNIKPEIEEHTEVSSALESKLQSGKDRADLKADAEIPWDETSQRSILKGPSLLSRELCVSKPTLTSILRKPKYTNTDKGRTMPPVYGSTKKGKSYKIVPGSQLKVFADEWKDSMHFMNANVNILKHNFSMQLDEENNVNDKDAFEVLLESPGQKNMKTEQAQDVANPHVEAQTECISSQRSLSPDLKEKDTSLTSCEVSPPRSECSIFKDVNGLELSPIYRKQSSWDMQIVDKDKDPLREESGPPLVEHTKDFQEEQERPTISRRSANFRSIANGVLDRGQKIDRSVESIVCEPVTESDDDDFTTMSDFAFIHTVAAIVIQTAIRRYQAVCFVKNLVDHCERNPSEEATCNVLIKDRSPALGSTERSTIANVRQCSPPKYLERSNEIPSVPLRQTKVQLDMSSDTSLGDAVRNLYEMAAIRIQAVFRSFWVRDSIDVDRYCATVIQKEVRGYCCRLKYEQDYARIVMVQSWWRRNIARDYAGEILAYVIWIQAAYRGYRVRREVRDFLMAKKSKELAIRKRAIQSRREYFIQLQSEPVATMINGSSNRSLPPSLNNSALLNSSAIKIQTRWRIFVAECQFLRCLVDILIMQTVMRRWLASRHVAALRSAKVCIIKDRIPSTDEKENSKDHNEFERNIPMDPPGNIPSDDASVPIDPPGNIPSDDASDRDLRKGDISCTDTESELLGESVLVGVKIVKINDKSLVWNPVPFASSSFSEPGPAVAADKENVSRNIHVSTEKVSHQKFDETSPPEGNTSTNLSSVSALSSDFITNASYNSSCNHMKSSPDERDRHMSSERIKAKENTILNEPHDIHHSKPESRQDNQNQKMKSLPSKTLRNRGHLSSPGFEIVKAPSPSKVVDNKKTNTKRIASLFSPAKHFFEDSKRSNSSKSIETHAPYINDSDVSLRESINTVEALDNSNDVGNSSNTAVTSRRVNRFFSKNADKMKLDNETYDRLQDEHKLKTTKKDVQENTILEETLIELGPIDVKNVFSIWKDKVKKNSVERTK